MLESLILEIFFLYLYIKFSILLLESMFLLFKFLFFAEIFSIKAKNKIFDDLFQVTNYNLLK